MTIGQNPELFISDPVYETTLEVPKLKGVEFVYVGYEPREMETEFNEVKIGNRKLRYRFAKLRWDYSRKQNQSLQGTEIVMSENMGSMTQEESRDVVDASSFFLNRSLQLILEDTIPEVRLDPSRFMITSPPEEQTVLQSQFISAVQSRLDFDSDDPDSLELYETYIESLREVLGPERVANTFDDVLSYLRDATEFLNEQQVSEEVQSFESPRSALKIKVNLSTRYAPGLMASAIASQGPFAMEINNSLSAARVKKNSFAGASLFRVDVTCSESKREIFDSFTKMNPTLDNLIRIISLLFTGQVIDPAGSESTFGDELVLAAYHELFEVDEGTINAASPQTQEVLNAIADRIGADLFTTVGTLASDLVQPVGFKVRRRELRPNKEGAVSVIKSDPFYVLDSRIRQVDDVRLRYGSVYEYAVSTVYRIMVPFISPGGILLKKTVLVASEASNEIRMVAEDFSPIQPVNCLEIESVRNDDLEQNGVRLMWNHVPDIKGKIRGFRLYRRDSNLKQPYRLMREFQFRKPPRTHELFYEQEIPEARRLAPDGPVIDTSVTVDSPGIPIRNFHDTEFRASRDYIYAVTAVDMHGNEGPLSDQITLSMDDQTQGTQEMISIRGAPVDWPNLFLDRSEIVDSKISNSIPRGRTKAVVFWDPIAMTVTDLDYRGQGIRTTPEEDTASPAQAAAYLQDNLHAFSAPVQKYSGRVPSGEQDGSDAFIFTADGSVLFDGISAEYDFMVFDETTLKTAMIRTNVKYGSGDDISANFMDD